MVMVLASIPSAHSVMSMVPDSTVSQSVSSSLETVMPSSPQEMARVIFPNTALSFAWMPSSFAVTEMSPPAIRRSSLQTMPCRYSAVTLRLPAPLMVRSSLENMAPRMLFSTAVSEYSAPLVKEFSVPSARVRKTLSASSMSRAALSEQETTAPFRRIQVFPLVLEVSSTMTDPSVSVPCRT